MYESNLGQFRIGNGVSQGLVIDYEVSVVGQFLGKVLILVLLYEGYIQWMI